jgi:hypothetical protein
MYIENNPRPLGREGGMGISADIVWGKTLTVKRGKEEKGKI